MAKIKLLTLGGLMAIATLLASMTVGMAIVNGLLTVPFGLGALGSGIVDTIVGWIVVAGGVLALLKGFGLMK